MPDLTNLQALDHAHVWHPFTPMKQWRRHPPLVIDRAQGDYLIDADGNRYIDGVSSLWCNVHGHRVPAIDQAIRDQLDKVAHSTLLGLASEPSIRLAAELVRRAPQGLNKVFYSDAGATALEAAFKMAVGYWCHTGKPQKNKFIAFRGAYHGDTTGAMSVGFSETFHRPFTSMVFPTLWAPSPDAPRAPQHLLQSLNPLAQSPLAPHTWPSESPTLNEALKQHCLAELEKLLQRHAHETAAIVIEPIMQGAAGMICQPPGFLRSVADLARHYNVLLIADEVAVGFGRTGALFACEQENVTPDILCLAKGITAGYLPLAATLATDQIEQAFTGEISELKTFFHGHTYTGNALACAAALASLELFDSTHLLDHIRRNAAIITDRLHALRDCPHVLDVRQRGIMVGIELCQDRSTQTMLDYSLRTGAALCLAMRSKGLILRPLGDVIVLMPIPAMQPQTLHAMLDIVIDAIKTWPFK